MQTETTLTKPDVLTCEEVAAFFEVHVATVRQWIKRGRLPVIRYGRAIKIKREVAIHVREHGFSFYEQASTDKNEQQQTPAQS